MCWQTSMKWIVLILFHTCMSSVAPLVGPQLCYIRLSVLRPPFVHHFVTKERYHWHPWIALRGFKVMAHLFLVFLAVPDLWSIGTMPSIPYMIWTNAMNECSSNTSRQRFLFIARNLTACLLASKGKVCHGLNDLSLWRCPFLVVHILKRWQRKGVLSLCHKIAILLNNYVLIHSSRLFFWCTVIRAGALAIIFLVMLLNISFLWFFILQWLCRTIGRWGMQGGIEDDKFETPVVDMFVPLLSNDKQWQTSPTSILNEINAY